MTPDRVKHVPQAIQFENRQLLALVEMASLIRAVQARATFEVNGAGQTAAVLDTGLRTTHVDFAGRVPAQANFTADNGGRSDDASDGHGHGTNVAGIICAGGDHTGIAPGARVVPIKVLDDQGGGSFDTIAKALAWTLEHHASHGISVVCMSLGDGANYRGDEDFEDSPVRGYLRALTDARVAVCVAAGNDYFRYKQQGMGFPGILRDAISVGAVYDAALGGRSYQDGAHAFSTGADRITPFSQRLHSAVGGACSTSVFAPGGEATSSGIQTDRGESRMDGTSQATPVVAGVILLVQELYRRYTGRLPTIELIRNWLRTGARAIIDGDDEADNVPHSGVGFQRVDAVGALTAVHRYFDLQLARQSRPLAQLALP